MDHKFIHFLSLFSLIYFAPIPIVIIFIHKTLPFWQKWGTKSYYFFILLFALAFMALFGLVTHFKEPILSWRVYDHPFSLLGIFPLVGGFILGMISIRTLSLRVLLGLPEFTHTQTELVVRGIYRYLRHPRYLEFILEAMGVAILSGLWINFLFLLYFILAVWFMAHIEEQELLERFGKSYLEYKKKTGGFIPFCSS